MSFYLMIRRRPRSTLFPYDALPIFVGQEAIRRFVTGAFGVPGFSIRWETTAFEVAGSGDMAYGVGTNVATVNDPQDRKSTRLNSSHGYISYAVFCLKKKNLQNPHQL